jgi:hypothetical protein
VAIYFHTGWQRRFGDASDRVVINPASGPAFSVVSRPGALVTVVEGQVFGAAMNIARLAADRAYAIVSMRIAGTPPGVGIVPATFAAHLHYCFRTGAVPLMIAATLNAVRGNIDRLRTGLWSRDLQIVDSNPNRGGIASGYVRGNFSELFQRRDAGREMGFAGRIHLRFGAYNAANTAVNQQNAAITIVHEATHKFCGARDWLYNAGGSAAYIALLAMGALPPLPPLTNHQALNNADSYAEFVMAM